MSLLQFDIVADDAMNNDGNWLVCVFETSFPCHAQWVFHFGTNEVSLQWVSSATVLSTHRTSWPIIARVDLIDASISGCVV